MYVIKVKRKESLKKKGIVCIIIHYPDVKNEKVFIGFSEMHIIDLGENSFSEVMVKTWLYWIKEHVEKKKSYLKLDNFSYFPFSKFFCYCHFFVYLSLTYDWSHKVETYSHFFIEYLPKDEPTKYYSFQASPFYSVGMTIYVPHPQRDAQNVICALLNNLNF